MCDFQYLYFAEDGYVICCKHCHYYQIAFGNTLLNITAKDFLLLREKLKCTCDNGGFHLSKNTKNIVVETPSQNLFLLFTRREATQFHHMIEEADIEAKAQSLIDLFY